MPSKSSPVVKVEISHRTIVFAVFFLISLYLLYFISDIIIGLFAALLLATALNPIVSKLEKLRVPRPLGILSIYSIILSTLIFGIGTVVPPLVEQTNKLIQTLPLDSISSQFTLPDMNLENIQLLTSQLGSVTPIINFVTSTFSGLIAVFTFLVITFYLLMERSNLHKHLVGLFGKDGQEERAEKYVNQIEHRIGGWVRGEISLMFIVGFITFIGLSLLKVPFALPLSIIAGLLEIIPNIGPTVAAIPAVFVALASTQNPVMAVFVIALYILVQQLENNLIVPKVMQSAVGLHPLVTLISIIVGLKLAGILGAILAVPIFLVVMVTFQELVKPKIS